MVGKTAKLKTLIVIDSIFWVTGTMAEQIRRRFVEYDILVCSYATLKIDRKLYESITQSSQAIVIFKRKNNIKNNLSLKKFKEAFNEFIFALKDSCISIKEKTKISLIFVFWFGNGILNGGKNS